MEKVREQAKNGKKVYEALKIDVLEFDGEDIITTSGDQGDTKGRRITISYVPGTEGSENA